MTDGYELERACVVHERTVEPGLLATEVDPFAIVVHENRDLVAIHPGHTGGNRFDNSRLSILMGDHKNSSLPTAPDWFFSDSPIQNHWSGSLPSSGKPLSLARR